MSQYYNIKGYQPGDTWNSGYGELQTFWLEIEGVEGTVKTNKKPGNTPRIGMVYGTLEQKTSQKGNKYYQFKTEQAPDGTTPPANTGSAPAPVQSAPQSHDNGSVPSWFIPYGNMIRKLYDDQTQVQVDTTPMPRQVVDDQAMKDVILDDIEPVKPVIDAGEGLTPEKKKELEDVFGGKMFDDEDEVQ